MSKLDSFIWWATLEVYRGELESDPSGSGILRVPSREELDRYFMDTCDVPYNTRTSWCGLYQTHLLKKAGVACQWIIGVGLEDTSGGKDLQIAHDDEAKKGLVRGDVVVVEHNGHHLMVAEPVSTGFIPSFEGNAKGKSSPCIAAYSLINARYNTVEQIRVRYRVVS